MSGRHDLLYLELTTHPTCAGGQGECQSSQDDAKYLDTHFQPVVVGNPAYGENRHNGAHITDRKSTRLNSSHVKISYAVFCLKKKSNGLSRASDGGRR